MRAKTKSVAVLIAGAMMLGCVNAWAAESPEALTEVQQETQQAAYELNFEGFQRAVKDGLAAREVLGTALKDEKLTEAEIQERYRAIAESEWEKVKDFEQAFSDAALTEMVVRYGCQFDAAAAKGMILADETDESSDAGLNKVIQAFAVAAGKLPDAQSSLDGIIGDRTIAALKDMQAEKGILTSGIINRNRVKELKEAYPALVENVNMLLNGSGLTVETYLPQEVSQQETTAQ